MEGGDEEELENIRKEDLMEGLVSYGRILVTRG